MYFLISVLLLSIDHCVRKQRFLKTELYKSKYLDVSINTVYNKTFKLKRALVINSGIMIYLLYCYLYHRVLNQSVLSILMAASLNCYDKYQNKHVVDYLYTKIYFYRSTENIADLIIILNIFIHRM